MEQRATAIVVGATGLVGSELVRQLSADDRCGRIVTLARRPLAFEHPKLEQRVIDFDAPESWRAQLRGDVLFSALGTTLKTAGSQAAQHLVDYTYQLRVAEAAAHCKVGTYVLVSATGASPQSLLFYSRMKGELERDVSALPFDRICILRPGLLQGPRTERRVGERLAIATLRHLPAWSALATVRPITVEVVARAARAAAFTEAPGSARSRPRLSLLPGSVIPEVYEAQDLFRLGHAGR
jgi:uncharacterized protein YbjT (DUF2867 family)